MSLHPLWSHLPPERRSWRDKQTLRLRRLWAWLKQKHRRIGLVVILYLLIWSIPLLAGEPLLSAFAVLPLGFLVHAPHPWSKSKRGWMKKGRGKHATDKLFKEADSKYDEASLRDGATPLCPGAKT